MRSEAALVGAVGKRLTYETTVQGEIVWVKSPKLAALRLKLQSRKWRPKIKRSSSGS